jgi:hypothetical protein
VRQKAHHHQHHREQANSAQRRIGEPASGAAHARQHAHQHHHQEVLGDQQAECHAAVQRVDLTLVPQQLDDDDGAGEGQSKPDRRRALRRVPEGHGKPRADHRRDQHLRAARDERHRSQRAQQAGVQLEAHQEQQHRHAEFAEQLHLRRVGHHAEHVRPGHDTGHDEGDDQGLAQPLTDRAEQRAQRQQGGDFVKRVVGHAGGLVAVRSARGGLRRAGQALRTA